LQHSVEGDLSQMGTRKASFGKALQGASGALPLVLSGLGAGGVIAAEAADPAKTFGNLLGDYCSKCHNADDWAGSLAFDTVDVGHVGEDPQVWEKTITKLRGRLMPPAGQNQPGQSEVDAAW